MKKTLFLFLIMTAYFFPQGWNNIVTTTISEPNLIKMDLFTNKDGNHIIVQNSNSTNSIKYYLLNSSGTVVRSSTIETAGEAEFPNVSGDNDKVYLVYKLGSNLKARKTTDAGQNWQTIDNKAIGTYTCNGVDIVYDYQGLHVVYSTSPSGLYDAETFYYNINSSNQWVDYKNVTDYGNEVGGIPTIAVSNNSVHVSYDNGSLSKTRDRLGTNWQTPQLVSDGEIGVSVAQKIQVKTDKLFSIFFDLWVDMGQYGYYIQVKSRDLTATQWPGSYSTIFTTGWPNVGIAAETTTNGNLNIINFGFSNGILFKFYDGNSWSNDFTVSPDFINIDFTNIGFSTSSNDLFVSWKPYDNNYLKYRQYDTAPLAPENLAVTKSAANHPLLSWTKNNEADFQHYKIYKFVSSELGWQHYGTATANSFEDIYETYYLRGGSAYWVYYKVTAVDLHPYESQYSNQIGVKVMDNHIEKFNFGTTPAEYSLNQNYPNPFNPSTKISFSIKEDGLATLKVYDILGVEIVTLVNEHKSAGYYEVEFNASNLPSGMYIYKLQSSSYTAAKKMILTK